MLYSMCAVFGDVYVSESPYLSVFFEKNAIFYNNRAVYFCEILYFGKTVRFSIKFAG